MNTSSPVFECNVRCSQTTDNLRIILGAALLCFAMAAISCSPAGSDVAAQLEQMSNRLGILEDTQAIRNLHYA